jgi:FtsZ-binding cell division protein ZapB
MTEHWDKIVFVIGLIGAYITGNKTKKIADKGGEIDNLIKYQNMYEKFTIQFEQQLSALESKVENLELRNAIIVEESQNWKEKFNALQTLYNKLKAEFEAYKKKHLSK